MKQRISLLLAGALMVGLLAGCGPAGETSSKDPGGDTSGTVSQQEPVTLVANSTANPGAAEVIALEKFKEEIEKSTNGMIQVEIHNSGTLFTADTETSALTSGEIDMCLTSFDWMAESGSEWASMFICPYLFTGYQDAYDTLTGDIGEEVFDRIYEEQHIRPLAPAYIGTRQLILRDDKEVKTTADLKGVLLRVPTTASYVAMAEAMGAVPTPMALDEVYLALQTGAIEAIEVPLSVMKSRSFFEVCKTLVMTNHLVTMKMIVMNGDTWSSFDEDTQQLILDAAAAAGLACDNNILESEETLKDEFAEKGMKIVEPDVKEFQNTVLSAFMDNQEIVGSWDMDLYHQIAGE